LIEYLVTVRNAPLNQFSFVSAGVWAGLALGRLVLAEPTHRYGENKMLLFYSILTLIFQIIIWQVNNAIADSVMAILMGFFLGPFFAAGISAATKLLRPSLHAAALSLIFVVAQAGGSLFPAVTGAIANKAGVGTLQPILVGLIVAMGVSWSFVPKIEHRTE
jgi:fucose permease